MLDTKSGKMYIHAVSLIFPLWKNIFVASTVN